MTKIVISSSSPGQGLDFAVDYKIRSRDLFSSPRDFLNAIKKAEADATEKSKAVLFSYILQHEKIPFKTGAMVESAANWLLKTALNGQFEVEIWFSMFYSTYVEDKVHFMEKIKPDIYAIIQQEFDTAFRNNGIDATVLING